MLALLLALQGPLFPAPEQAPADSVPRVTLTEALQRAARLDPNYVTALGQIDNAQWIRRNAFAVFILPAITVGLNATQSNPIGFSFVPVKTAWSAQLSARYDLFLGGQKFAELTRSAALLDAAHQNELVERFATALTTESDYYAVIANTELDRVNRERVRRAREQLAVARARVVSGAAVSTDSLNLRLELARAQVGQLQQESALRVSRLELGRRVGASGPVDAMAPDTTPAPQLPVTLADAISEAARQGPDYRLAAANERAASASYRGQLGNYLPHATLTFNAFSFDTVFYPKLFKQTNFQLGISLPLWDNGQRELALSRARVIKNVARATTGVSVSRQIYLRNPCVLIEQRAEALNYVETNFSNILPAQPFENRPTLNCHWQRAKSCHRKFYVARIGELTIDPSFFYTGNCRSAPDGGTNVSAEDFLQVRNDATADAVAKRIEILVRCVLAKSKPMFAHIVVDLFAPNTEKRPHDCQPNFVNTASRNLTHGSEACAACTAKKIDQESFDLIISVMREKNRVAVVAFRGASKKQIARLARCGFN